MKKLLALSLFLLSGCVSDTTVYKHYSVNAPKAKASLFIEKPDYTDEWKWNQTLSGSPMFQETFSKYFVKSDERHADFILRQTSYKDETGDGTFAWAFFSGFTLGVLPMWGENKITLSYSLTDTKNDRTVQLSDVQTKFRLFFGWLMMPAIIFPGVHFMDDDFDGRSISVAVEEAASLVYDSDSKLYQQTKRKNWGAPAAKEQAPTAEEPGTSTPVEKTPPVKQTRPEEMDMLW